MRLLIVGLLALALSACTSTEELVEATKVAQTDYNTCQANYYEASELVRIELKEDGSVKSMVVGNQNLQGCQMAKAPESVGVAAVKGFTTVATAGLRVVGGAIPYAVIGDVAKEGIKAAGAIYTDSNNVISGDVATRGDEIASGDVITSGDVATRGDETVRGDEITSGDVISETAGNDLIKAGNDVQQNPVSSVENPAVTTIVVEPAPVIVPTP